MKQIISILIGMFMGSMLTIAYLPKTNDVSNDYKNLKALTRDLAFSKLYIIEENILNLLKNDDILSIEQISKIKSYFIKDITNDNKIEDENKFSQNNPAYYNSEKELRNDLLKGSFEALLKIPERTRVQIEEENECKEKYLNLVDKLLFDYTLIDDVTMLKTIALLKRYEICIGETK